MKAVVRIVFVDSEGEKFFGEGPFRLLVGVDETGSLKRSADKMCMAYTKALRLLNNAEKALGFPLTERETGGKNGGGSRLTKEGKAWLRLYEEYTKACKSSCAKLYDEFFSETDKISAFDGVGCVVMASGEGKRFGGNKLLADINGFPVIENALSIAKCFEKSVVVTRSSDVLRYCEDYGIKCILHSLPNRSDTVRIGLEALDNIKACVFLQGDQPLLSKSSVVSLALAWQNEPNRIWRLSHNGKTASPILFPKLCFKDLLSLKDGEGGGAVVMKYPELLSFVEAGAESELWDVDTADDLEKVKKHIINSEISIDNYRNL